MNEHQTSGAPKTAGMVALCVSCLALGAAAATLYLSGMNNDSARVVADARVEPVSQNEKRDTEQDGVAEIGGAVETEIRPEPRVSKNPIVHKLHVIETEYYPVLTLATEERNKSLQRPEDLEYAGKPVAQLVIVLTKTRSTEDGESSFQIRVQYLDRYRSESAAIHQDEFESLEVALRVLGAVPAANQKAFTVPKQLAFRTRGGLLIGRTMRLTVIPGVEKAMKEMSKLVDAIIEEALGSQIARSIEKSTAAFAISPGPLDGHHELTRSDFIELNGLKVSLLFLDASFDELRRGLESAISLARELIANEALD